jgi:hypothetical protein
MPRSSKTLTLDALEPTEFKFDLPDPADTEELEFQRRIDQAWQVCDRFDLQTDIWRGRILRAVRDREKQGRGFLNWLSDREISKNQAYKLIELANCADTLLEGGHIEPEDVSHFSKQAFIETAQAEPEIQQLVTDAVKQGDRITRREVKQLSDDWIAMSSELLPEAIREKVVDQTIPTRYVAPLVKHLEKLPEAHQFSIRQAISEQPDLDTLKQATGEARSLSRYLEAAPQVQALNDESIDIENALDEAMRLGCLNSAAELVNQAAQLENTIVKLYTTWKRVNSLSGKLFEDTGASTPHLRAMLKSLERLSSESIEFYFGDPRGENFSHTIRLKLEDDNNQ